MSWIPGRCKGHFSCHGHLSLAPGGAGIDFSPWQVRAGSVLAQGPVLGQGGMDSRVRVVMMMMEGRKAALDYPTAGKSLPNPGEVF